MKGVPTSVSINDGGYLGKTLELSPMGNMRVSPMTRLIGSTFWGTTIDGNFWNAQVSGAGSAVSQGAAGSSNQAIMTVTNTNPALAVFQTLRVARYIGASANVFRAVVQLGTNTGIANNTRRWGAFNTGALPASPAPVDGAYFELSGTTFQVVTCRNSVPTPIASGSFNGKRGLTWAPDLDSHTYEIYWTNSSVWFCVDDQLLHKASFGSAPWSDYSSLRATAENLNSGGAPAGGSILYVRVMSISRLGPSKTRPKWMRFNAANAGTVLKYGPGTLHGVCLNSTAVGSTLAIYDDVAIVAANQIALINTNNANLAFQPFGIDGLDFYNGLFIVIVNAPDLTIIYE